TLAAIFFFQAEDGIRDFHVTGVQTCALPILELRWRRRALPPRRRGAPDPACPPLRPGPGRPHIARRAVAAPDHGRLRGDAAAARSEERRVGKEGKAQLQPQQHTSIYTR